MTTAKETGAATEAGFFAAGTTAHSLGSPRGSLGKPTCHRPAVDLQAIFGDRSDSTNTATARRQRQPASADGHVLRRNFAQKHPRRARRKAHSACTHAETGATTAPGTTHATAHPPAGQTHQQQARQHPRPATPGTMPRPAPDTMQAPPPPATPAGTLALFGKWSRLSPANTAHSPRLGAVWPPCPWGRSAQGLRPGFGLFARLRIALCPCKGQMLMRYRAHSPKRYAPAKVAFTVIKIWPSGSSSILAVGGNQAICNQLSFCFYFPYAPAVRTRSYGLKQSQFLRPHFHILRRILSRFLTRLGMAGNGIFFPRAVLRTARKRFLLQFFQKTKMLKLDKSTNMLQSCNYMGSMNLLKASINGKVGEVYGAKWKGQNVIKAVPFSHAPHNEAQTNAVRAFECVNRVAGGLAKYFWYYLNLSDKKMLKHNAVAQWLKPALKDGVFTLSAIPALVRDDGTTSIAAVSVNRSTGAYALEVNFSDIATPAVNTQGAVLLVDEFGKVIFGSGFSGPSFARSGLARLNADYKYYCLLFRSDKVNDRWQPNSFKLAEATYTN